MDDKLRKHMRAMSDALISVRPLGGSELFVKVGDEFYADPVFCAAAIKELRDKLHDANVALAIERKRVAA